MAPRNPAPKGSQTQCAWFPCSQHPGMLHLVKAHPKALPAVLLAPSMVLQFRVAVQQLRDARGPLLHPGRHGPGTTKTPRNHGYSSQALQCPHCLVRWRHTALHPPARELGNCGCSGSCCCCALCVPLRLNINRTQRIDCIVRPQVTTRASVCCTCVKLSTAFVGAGCCLPDAD